MLQYFADQSTKTHYSVVFNQSNVFFGINNSLIKKLRYHVNSHRFNNIAPQTGQKTLVTGMVERIDTFPQSLRRSLDKYR